MELTIRDLQQSDKPELRKMVFGLYDEDDLEISMTEDIFERNFAQGLKGDDSFRIVLLETPSGDAAGYAMLMKQWSGEAGGWTLLLDELYVKAEYRGHGLGTKFLHWLDEQYADEVYTFYLETSKDNETARKLYRRVGFEESTYQTMQKHFPD